MCTHDQKFNHNQYKFEHFLKNFKVQLQLHKVENFFKNIQSPVQVNWVWKNSKDFQSPTQVRPDLKKFKISKYKCLAVKCQKNSENILSPNQRWLNKEKFPSLNPKTNGWKPKNKFKVQTGWDIFKCFLNMAYQCMQKVFGKEIVWKQIISFINEIYKCKEHFNSDSTKF